MKKFVINLKRRPDRLENFKNNCPIITDVVYGFDSKNHQLETDDSEQFLYNTVLECLSKNERGVFISHYRIYKNMVKNNYNSAMIFEDDAIFTNSFDVKIKHVIKELPKNWHICFFGGRFTKDYVMNSSSVIKVSDRLVEHNIHNFNNHDHDRTFHGYLLSNLGAKFLIEQLEKIYPKSLAYNIFDRPTDTGPVDHWVIRLFYKNNIKVYSSTPLLCHSPLVGDSDIR